MEQNLLRLSSPLAIIYRYLVDHSISSDDRRRAMGLFSSHADVAADFANEIVMDRNRTGILHSYLDRIIRDQAKRRQRILSPAALIF